jgi:hypothetical protein
MRHLLDLIECWFRGHWWVKDHASFYERLECYRCGKQRKL